MQEDFNILLEKANNHRYFTFLNGNNIPYLYDNFGIHLAFGNREATSNLSELKQLRPGLRFGHFGYDLKNQLENLWSDNLDNINFPDLHFFEPDEYHTSELINFIIEDPSESKPVAIKSRFSKEAYISIINQLRNHIIEGDCYEINFCMEFYSEEVEIDPINTYKKLNNLSPMPFSALHKVDDKYLICASPERFIKKAGNKVISQPIKGTMRKGATNQENEELKKQLYNSEKERAENLMIVDLVRNDLAKSANPGSVHVDELFGIYDFASVNQMISTVVAEKGSAVTPLDVILNAFPMGSMTGAPKHKVMQLIERYEKTKRGIYSGAIGYIKENGDFDFNVVIRSIAYNSKTKYLSFQVGGAITYDSDPEQEYEECLLKASAIRRVLS